MVTVGRQNISDHISEYFPFLSKSRAFDLSGTRTHALKMVPILISKDLSLYMKLFLLSIFDLKQESICILKSWLSYSAYFIYFPVHGSHAIHFKLRMSYLTIPHVGMGRFHTRKY